MDPAGVYSGREAGAMKKEHSRATVMKIKSSGAGAVPFLRRLRSLDYNCFFVL